MNDSRDPIVRLRGVEKSFGPTRVVKGIDLDVQPGEFLTLLGPSGCGKTTTLRLISGFEVPNQGTIEIDGRIVNDIPPFKRNVNTVFQNYALFPHLSIFENVAYGLTVRRRPRQEIDTAVRQMLERVDLAGREDAMPGELSGGQMQRVALARALINQPSVLLLDEPLGALDALLRKQLQLELKRTQREFGITFIYVTHDQEEAMVMSDRVVLLNGGCMEQVGSPREIYDYPATRFVASFVGSGNFLAGSVVSSSLSECSVRLTSGTVVSCRPDITLRVGNDAEVFVRPEQIVARPVNTTRTDERIAMIGHLLNVIETGPIQRLAFETPAGDGIIVDRMPQGNLVSTNLGSKWSLELPTEPCSAFPLVQNVAPDSMEPGL